MEGRSQGSVQGPGANPPQVKAPPEENLEDLRGGGVQLRGGRRGRARRRRRVPKRTVSGCTFTTSSSTLTM